MRCWPASHRRRAPPIRQTVDVDLLTEVAPLSNYYVLCERLREKGFKENDELICRWQLQGLKIDVMPTEENVLNFTKAGIRRPLELRKTINYLAAKSSS